MKQQLPQFGPRSRTSSQISSKGHRLRFVRVALALSRQWPRFVMNPTNKNRSEALIFTGVGSLFTAIAAVLLEYSLFAGIFAFFSAFALAVALQNARERR